MHALLLPIQLGWNSLDIYSLYSLEPIKVRLIIYLRTHKNISTASTWLIVFASNDGQ